MTKHEQPSQPDPRLEDPDKYFAERYGDVTVRYGEHALPLRTALEFENLARTTEDIQSDPKERRANVFISMLREAEALDPEDDITYSERP